MMHIKLSETEKLFFNTIVCQWLAADQWFSPGTTVSSTNKTDHHNIAEILLKVALNSIILTPFNKIRNFWKLWTKVTNTNVQTLICSNAKSHICKELLKIINESYKKKFNMI